MPGPTQWAYRPLEAALSLSVDWWKNGAAGVNPATLDAATSSTNWLTPKTHGQMAAFTMAWGRGLHSSTFQLNLSRSFH